MHICIMHMGHTCHSYVPVPTILVITIYAWIRRDKGHYIYIAIGSIIHTTSTSKMEVESTTFAGIRWYLATIVQPNVSLQYCRN